MKTFDVYIRTVADAVSGMGHLSRMLTLADYFREMGDECVFGVDRSSSAAIEHINSMGFSLGSPSPSCTIVVYDLIDAVWRDSKCALYCEIDQHRKLGRKVIFFDGRGENSYRQCDDAVAVDYLIAPYVGEVKVDLCSSTKFLLGPDYFPLDPKLICGPKREIRETVQNILLTAGGSDPYSASRLVLEAVLTADNQGLSEVHVVVGGMFNESLTLDLERVASEFSHRVFLHKGLTDLSELMAQADLCVCANGLTKHELAAMGVPTIVVSINDINHEINQEFVSSGAVVLGGSLDKLSPRTLAAQIFNLMNDHPKRLLLSHTARKLIDGNGLSRIRTAIGL